MWLKFIKDCETNRNKDIIWTDDDASAIKQVNNGNAVRCLGPDGEIFEDSSPEAIITQLAAEDGLTFKEEEDLIREERKSLSLGKQQQASLGNYLDEKQISDRIVAKETKLKGILKEEKIII